MTRYKLSVVVVVVVLEVVTWFRALAAVGKIIQLMSMPVDIVDRSLTPCGKVYGRLK